MDRPLCACLVLWFGVTGCQEPNRPTGTTVTEAWENVQSNPPAEANASVPDASLSPPQSTPLARASGEQAIAYVNDKPVSRRAVVDTLIRGYGLGVLQQQLLLEAVRQAGASAGHSITRGEIEREYDETIRASHLDGNSPDTLTPVRRQELIELWLRRTGVSAAELDVAMTRQAWLRKLADPRVTVSEEQIREEYERVHGEKVEIRHIQLDSLRDYDRLRPRLEAGEDFAALAALFSVNQATGRDGGLLPPFSAEDTRFPATLREAAFKLKPGEFTHPVQYDGAYHVLKLERRIPATGVPPASVREALAADVRARLVATEMDRLGLELLNRATIRIEDPILRAEYERQRAAGRITGPPLAQ